MTSHWIPLAERERWLGALEGIDHGFTHGPEYSAVTAQATGHDAGLWYWQDDAGRAVCPVGRRPAPGGGFDVVTPMGFGGFAMAGDVAGLPAAWTLYWRDAGALAAYVQLSPWKGETAWRAALHGYGEALAPSRECWLWDLRPDPDALMSRLDPNHRRALQQWDEATCPCWERGELVPAFHRLYAAFLAEHEVGVAYRFTPAALSTLANAPGALWIGARGDDGDVEAVAIFIWHGQRADLFLAATTPAGRRHSRGLYWHGAQRLRELGVGMLNLGGGVTDGDPLARFKKRFGAEPRTTLALRQVLDPAGFERARRVAGVADGDGRRFPPWLET